MNAIDYLNKQIDAFNKKTIEDAVRELDTQFPPEPYDDMDVYFDANGGLLDGEPTKTITDYQNKIPYKTAWGGTSYNYNQIPNPDYLPPRQNYEFVAAIKLVDIVSGKPRHGWVKFEHHDGPETQMTFAQFKKVAPKMIRGWLIGRFAYRTYYGTCEIFLLESLI